MSGADEATVGYSLGHRIKWGIRHPKNWWQLVRFGLVGASGYAVNLVAFALCVHAAGLDYRVAAVIAFVVSVLNNFWWNRHWTFVARDGHAGFQAVRFFVISLLAFAISFVVLQLLVGSAGMPEVAAQAIAIVVATPFNFIGNKLWSFGT